MALQKQAQKKTIPTTTRSVGNRSLIDSTILADCSDRDLHTNPLRSRCAACFP